MKHQVIFRWLFAPLLAAASLVAVTSCSKESKTVTPSTIIDQYLTDPPGTEDILAVIAQPADAATGIDVSSDIIIVFNHDIDPTTVNSTNIIISPAIVGAWSTNGHTVTFNPTADLPAATSYTITATQAVTSTAAYSSRPLSQVYTWSFTTAADNSSSFDPTVIARAPMGAGVLVNVQHIEVTFSETVTGVDTTSYSLFDGTATVTGTTVSNIAGTNTWRLTIPAPLNYGATYTVQFTTAIKDADANSIDAPTAQWTFSTQAAPATNPAVTITSSYIRNVTTTGAEICWTTSVPLAAADSTYGYSTSSTVTLSSYSGTDPSFTQKNSSFIQPISGLTPGSQYYFKISCTGATDVTGNFQTPHLSAHDTQQNTGTNSQLNSLQLSQIGGTYDGSSASVCLNGANINATYFNASGSNIWGTDGNAVFSNGSLSPRIFADGNSGTFVTGQLAGNIYAKHIYNNAGSAGFFSPWGADASAGGVNIGTGTNPSIVMVYGGQGNQNLYSGFFTKITEGTTAIDSAASIYDFDVDLSAAAFSNADYFVDIAGKAGTTVTKSTKYKYCVIEAAPAVSAGESYKAASAAVLDSASFVDHSIRNTVDDSTVNSYTSGTASGPDFDMYSGHGASSALIAATNIVYNAGSGEYGEVNSITTGLGVAAAAETGTTFVDSNPPIDEYSGNNLVPNPATSWTDSYDNALVYNTSDGTLARVVAASSPWSFAATGTKALTLNTAIFNSSIAKDFEIYTRYCSTHPTDLNQIDPFYKVNATIAATSAQTFDFHALIPGVSGTADTPPTNALYDDTKDFSALSAASGDFVFNFTDLSGLPAYATITDVTRAAQGALGMSSIAAISDADAYAVLRFAIPAQSSNILETGTSDGASTGTLASANSDFATTAVKAGDLVYNITNNSYSVVKSRTDANNLTLTRSINFSAGDKFIAMNFIINGTDEPVIDAGTVTTAGNPFTDSAAAFVAAGVKPGDTVHNRNTGGDATVTAVSATQITLSPAITMNAGDPYAILQSRVATVYENSGNIICSVNRLDDASLYRTFDVTTTSDASSPLAAAAENGMFYAAYNRTTSTYIKKFNAIGTTMAAETLVSAGSVSKIRSNISGASSFLNVLAQNTSTFTFARYTDTLTASYAPKSFTGTIATFELDPSANALVAYLDASGDIVVTRIDTDGSTAYSYTIDLNSSTTQVFKISIASDGAGGALISWIDNRYYSTVGLTLQSMHVLSTGAADTTYDNDTGAGTDYTGKLIGVISSWATSSLSLSSNILFYNDGSAPFGALYLWYDFRNSSAPNVFSYTASH